MLSVRLVWRRAWGLLVLAIIVWEGGAVGASEPAWEMTKSDHVVVYSQAAAPGDVERLLTKAEQCYRSITERLGFTRFDGFWTWDQRAKIYLYPDQQAFQASVAQPGWAQACANVHTREIHTYLNRPLLFDAVLPHELAHLTFREFVGVNRTFPLWLDEGIACFLEEFQQPVRLMTARAIARTARFIPWEQMARVGRDEVTDPEAFYAEAASVMEFLAREHGRARFVEFCRRLRDTGQWESSLMTVYRFSNLVEFRDRWVAFLERLGPGDAAPRPATGTAGTPSGQRSGVSHG